MQRDAKPVRASTAKGASVVMHDVHSLSAP
jgi:hypothetical protein